MNFQTVSTAEKLPTSDGLDRRLPRRRRDAGTAAQPRARLRRRQGRRRCWRRITGRAPRRTAPRSSCRPSTASRPDTPSALTRIPDGPIIDALNAAWAGRHPSGAEPLVAFAVDDDGMLIWLQRPLAARPPTSPRRSCSATTAPATTSTAHPKPYTASGLDPGLRRRRRPRVLRRAARRPAGARRDRHRPVRRRSTPAGRARSPSTAAPTRRIATSRWSSPAMPCTTHRVVNARPSRRPRSRRRS